MTGKNCFFIGHREASNSIIPELRKAVEMHITEYGVTNFVVGHYGQFDALAALAVIDAKKRHPTVTLTMLIPYHPSERPVTLSPGFDGSYYPAGMETVPRRYAIARANRAVIDETDYLIAYVWHAASNSRELVEYAIQKGVAVTMIGNNGKPTRDNSLEALEDELHDFLTGDVVWDDVRVASIVTELQQRETADSTAEVDAAWKRFLSLQEI